MNEAEELAERIRSGASMGAVLFSLLPAPYRSALRRCAAQRSVDSSLYEKVLREPGGPDFDALLRAGHLELAPGADDRYRVVTSLQGPAFDEWWVEAKFKAGEQPIPEALQAQAAVAASYHHAGNRRIDELDQLLLCDSSAALALFVQLYDATDATHDLPACQAILDVLESPYRLPLLDPSVLDAWHDRTCYLAARTLWAAEYHQSARYLPRHGLEKLLEQLLAGGEGRLLQLYGRGGMGKTMQLRWFVARRCVPAPHRIPCARIDFDAVAASTAARHPWLLLLEIAAQLDRQFAYGVYQDLLTSYGPYRPLLFRSGGLRGSVETPVRAIDIDGEDIRSRFTSGLVERVATPPVVVVLDTVEELLLRLGDEPIGLLRLLRQLHDDVGALRLVFASRYDLRERLPSLDEALPGLRSVSIPAFDDDEQRRYLQGIRRIDDPELLEAIVAKSGGTPFTLAVFADLVHQEPGIEPKEIRELDDPSIQYAIKRVVSRVDDDQVQWLLRYGVVPRTLSFRFLTDVMAPFLESGLEGRSPDDDPHRDPRSHEDAGEVWRQGRTQAPRTEVEYRDLWKRLTNYASASSWVWVVGEQDDAVCFHPEILRPLRNLVRSQRVYKRLNLAAARHYEELAAHEQSDKFAELMCEAVYHSFQADPAAAVATWRHALAQARAAGRPEWTMRLTEELLGRDYRDRSGAPHEGITPQTLADAYLERGRAAADLAARRQAAGEDSLWSDAEAGLRAAQALAKSNPGVELPQLAATVLEGRLLIAQNRAGKAEELLRKRQEHLAPSAELADLERALGDALQRLRRPEATWHYRKSYGLAVEAGDIPGAHSAVVNLAFERVTQGRSDEALQWLDTAAGAGVVGSGDEYAAFLRAFALGAAGAPDQGDRGLRAFLLEHPGASSSLVPFLRCWLLALAGRHEAAVAAASQVLEQLAQKQGPAIDLTAETLWIRGSASGKLLDFATAVDDLMAAASRSRDLRDLDGAAEYAAEAATVQMLRMGDLRSAAQSVDEANRTSGELGCEGWAAALVAQARLRDRTGQPDAARALIDGARAVLTDERSRPGTWVEVALGGLGLSTPTAEDLRLLVDRLKHVYPPAARLVLLDGLGEVRSLPRDADPDLRRAFVDVALPQRSAGGSVPGPEPGEAAWLNLTAAEVLRLAGRTGEALELLDEAVRARGDDLMWWRWLEARRRVGPADADGPHPPEWLAIGGRFPVLGGAYLVRLAEYRLQLDGLERARERLKRAEGLLARSVRPHRWTARLLEAQARLAYLDGDADMAARAAASAARIWGGLGDTRRRAMLGSEYRLGASTVDPDVRRLELRITRTDPGSERDVPAAHTVALLPDGRKAEQTRPTAKLGDLAGGLGESMILARVRSVVDRIVDRERDWEVEAGWLIPADARRLLAAAGHRRRLDVRMITEERELAALPWELVRLPEVPGKALVDLPGVATLYRTLPPGPRDENKIRALQELLGRLRLYDGVADGLMGEVTTASLRQYQRRAGLPVDGVPGRTTWDALRRDVAAGRRRQVRVLVIHPDRGRELVRRRGPTAGGTDLVQVYQRYGAKVWSLKDPTPEQLRVYGELLRDEPPDVIHVAGTVTLNAGATVLDFGGDAATRTVVKGMVRADQIPVTALSDLVAALSDAPFGPTVLVDVAAPHTRAETVRALLVRNSLAHQLLGLGHAVAVLATGLAAPSHQDDLSDLLASGIVLGDDPAALVRRVRSALLSRESFETVLPFLGSALYVHRSPYTLLPLGVS